MTLENKGSLWRNTILELKQENKKYIKNTIFIYIMDIIITAILMYSMCVKGSAFQSYLFILVFVSLILTMWMNAFINPAKRDVYKFYKRFNALDLENTVYYITAQNLYNILYCSCCKRLESDRTLESYFDLLIANCNEDIGISSTFMKYFLNSKIQTNDPSTENTKKVTITTLKRKNKVYFIDYTIEEANQEEVNNECDNDNE